MRTYLVARFDVTDLTERERDNLAGYVSAQAEAADDEAWEGEPTTGYPDVRVEVTFEDA